MSGLLSMEHNCVHCHHLCPLVRFVSACCPPVYACPRLYRLPRLNLHGRIVALGKAEGRPVGLAHTPVAMLFTMATMSEIFEQALWQ